MTGKDWVELFKFPLTIFVAIISLVIAGLVLGIKPTSFHYGEMEVEFEHMKKELILTNLNMQEAFIDLKASDTTEGSEPEPPPEVEMQQNTVSDRVAQFSMVETEEGPQSVFKHVTGYIFIGSFNKATESYENIKVEIPGDDLRRLRPGTVTIVNDNLVIRENSPVKNVRYYKGEKKVGLANRGSEVRILERPQMRDLGDFQEYWMKVELLN